MTSKNIKINRRKMIERNSLLTEKEEEENRITEENLNLGRIFMAIDNINQRCLDGYQKIKQDYEDQNKEKDKAMKQVREEKKPIKQPQDEENFDVKCQQASIKLKQIVQNLNDFKKIIEGCKNEIKNKQK